MILLFLRSNRYLFFSFFITYFLTPPVFSSYNYQWRNFTRFKNQLVSNKIRKIAISPTGQVWAGTDRGLLRFDGFWHNVILKIPQTTTSISIVSVQDLSFRGNGDLLVATNVGLFIGQWENNPPRINWHTFHSEQTGLLSNYISAVWERNNGEIWVGTSDGVSWKGLTDINWQQARTEQITDIYEDMLGRLWLAHQLPNPTTQNPVRLTLVDEKGENWQVFSTQNGLPNGRIQSIASDQQQIWVGTTKGLVVYDGKAWKKNFNWFNLTEANIQVLHLDQKQNLWVGTDKGIFLVNTNTDEKSAIEHLTKSSGLTGNDITAISESSSGHIWVGTRDNGISFSDLSWRTFQTTERAGNRVICFVKGKGNNIWVGTDNGIGRIIIRPSNERFSHVSQIPFPIISNISVRSLAYTTKGQIWAGTENGVLVFDGQKWEKIALPSGTESTQALIIDDNQQIWFSTALLLPNDATGFLPTLLTVQSETLDSKVVILRSVQNRIGRAITTLLIDYKERLWLATVGNKKLPSNLWIYEPTATPQKQLTEVARQQFGQIRTFLEMDGNLWIGTNQGIYLLSLNETPIVTKHYTTNQGLIDNNIQSLFRDTKNQVWVGTSEGVSIVKFGRVIRQLTATDGLNSDNVFAITETNSGEMLFGTAEGISSFKQERIAPVTRILEGPVENPVVGETTVTFKFVGGDASSESFQYQYKIDQNDFLLTGESGRENRVVLSGLAQGPHQFVVQAIDQENNVDTVGAHANFTVDSLAPIAQIFSPPNQQMINGLFQVQGIATDNSDFSEYTMQIFSQSGARKIIHRAVKSIDSGTLFSWQTKDFPDGSYILQLDVTDTLDGQFDLQHHSQAKLNVTIDNTSPVVFVKSSLSESKASGSIPLEFLIQETNLEKVQLGYQRHVMKQWVWSDWLTNLNFSDSNNSYTYLWETKGIDGLIDLQIRAQDIAGNLGQSKTIVLQLDNHTAKPQVELEPIQNIVSGTVNIFATIQIGSAPEAEIQSSWLRFRSTDQSNWQILWFGLNKIENQKIATWDTTVLVDGSYIIELTVTDNHQYQTVRQQTVIIDNKPPIITLQSPSNFQVISQQNSQILGSVKDDHLQKYTLSYRSDFSKDNWQFFWTNSIEVEETNIIAQWNTIDLNGGNYQLRLQADDFAGLSSQLVVNVVVDSMDVVAQITLPKIDQMIDGTIQIIGTASDENLKQFQLAFKRIADEAWQPIIVEEPTISQVNGLLANWSTPNTDGVYQIQLIVTDGANKSQTVTRRVFIDNLPPIAKILTPIPDQIISNNIEITGTADDAYFANFQLQFRSTVDGENWNPIPAINPKLARQKQLLSIWQLPAVDGPYQIRLQAQDKIGHITSQNVYVIIDNLAPIVEITSPTPGRFVSGKIPILGRVIDKNLEKFELKVKSVDEQLVTLLRFQQGNQSIDFGQLIEWQTPDIESDFEILLEATDQSGNSSIYMTLVTVDNRKPQTTIINPTVGQQVGQIVSIRGTATDKNFRLYKLEYTSSDGQSNQDLNSIWSPISKQPFLNPVKRIGLLNEWQVPKLVGAHIIRIRVVDYAGHESQDQVEVFFMPELDSLLNSTTHSQNQKVHIVVAPNSIETPTVITINPVMVNNEYLIQPTNLTFLPHKPAILSFQITSPEATGIFHWSGDQWKYIGGTTELTKSPNRISVPIQRLGRYRLAPKQPKEENKLEFSNVICQPRIFSPGRQQSAAISFSVSRSVPITISIYDTSEREQRLLVNQHIVNSGRHIFWWDGRNQIGEQLASDIYLVAIQAGNRLETKVIVIKND